MIPWVWPPHSNSDHQDYYIFSRGSQTKPSFVPTVTVRGPYPSNACLNFHLSLKQVRYLTDPKALGTAEGNYPAGPQGYVNCDGLVEG